MFGDLPEKSPLLPLGFQFKGNEDLKKTLAATCQKRPFSPRQHARCDRTLCATPDNDLVVVFPYGHSFHRSCIAPYVDFCFVCRTGLLLAVRQKAEIPELQFLVLTRTTSRPTAKTMKIVTTTTQFRMFGSSPQQAAANLQELVHQVAALPPMQLW